MWTSAVLPRLFFFKGYPSIKYRLVILLVSIVQWWHHIKNENNWADFMHENVSVKSMNTWRTGGRVARLLRPSSLAQLQYFLRCSPSEDQPIILGLGSNVAFADHDMDLTLILTHKGLKDISLHEDCIVAQAGVSCAKLAKFAASHGFAEASFFAGIPGTVGGALAMNAGAWGSDTWTHVQRVDMMDYHGALHTFNAAEFATDYRHVQSPLKGFFTQASFHFSGLRDITAAQQTIAKILQERKAKQPIGTHTCGSVFKNPPGDFAARLIDASGMKGVSVGAAQVSTKHANFILNKDGQASTKDIETLILLIQQQVQSKWGCYLQPEVRFIRPKQLEN